MIERVKVGGNEITLLVVDLEVDDYFKKNDIFIFSLLFNVSKFLNFFREGKNFGYGLFFVCLILF